MLQTIILRALLITVKSGITYHGVPQYKLYCHLHTMYLQCGMNVNITEYLTTVVYHGDEGVQAGHRGAPYKLSPVYKLLLTIYRRPDSEVPFFTVYFRQ